MDKVEITCRSCGASNLQVFLNLGKTPLADRLITFEQLDEEEPVFPLEVAFCPDCSLVQILETVPPEILFCDKYPYYSSFSPALLAHSKDNVSDLIHKKQLTGDSFVVEIASNDGYLLKNYVENGIPCLGVDPAEGPAKVAEEIGVRTLNSFFTKELAENLKSDGRSADVIHANNVLAHVEDTNGFVEGIGSLLKEDGVAVIEVPYVKDLIEKCEFDTIYHEHLCYFSVSALNNLFRRYFLYLNEVKRLPIHGGSLRLYVSPFESVQDSVKNLLKEEKENKIDKIDFFKDFADRVHLVKRDLLALVERLKEEGHSIAAYGAAAKGATLVNYTGIDKQHIEFVVDRNVHKQGKYMPGKHWPIYDPEKLLVEVPDYVLLLAWNFADEILEQQYEYRKKGGRFIVPIPEPRIV
jgi:SAM-dependent methyltransferase